MSKQKNKDGLSEFFELISKSQKYSKVIKRKHKELLDDNYLKVGRIINCHLVIENLVTQELEELKIVSKDDQALARFSFFQKVTLLPGKGKTYSELIPAIKELNSLRNKIAHNLKFDVEKFELKEIKKVFIQRGSKKYNGLDSERSIVEFSDICISVFSFRDPHVKKLFADFQDKYPNTKFLFSKMV